MCARVLVCACAHTWYDTLVGTAAAVDSENWPRTNGTHCRGHTNTHSRSSFGCRMSLSGMRGICFTADQFLSFVCALGPTYIYRKSLAPETGIINLASSVRLASRDITPTGAKKQSQESLIFKGPKIARFTGNRSTIWLWRIMK